MNIKDIMDKVRSCYGYHVQA